MEQVRIMKYLHTYENFLILEIGEAGVDHYPIDNYLELEGPINTMTYNYIFDTDSGLRYAIDIMRNVGTFHFKPNDVKNCKLIDEEPYEFYKKLMLVSFFTFTGDDEEMFYNYDDTTIQNRGELFKIMSTLKYAMEDYLSKNKEVKYIFIGGQRGEKGNDKEQRDRLYLTYFKRIKPEWQIDKIYCEFMHESYYIVKIKDLGKTFEELGKDSLTDLEARISDYFDEAKTGNKVKRDALYALLTVAKDESPDLYNKYKKKYDELK
jgi:hypothetical protein